MNPPDRKHSKIIFATFFKWLFNPTPLLSLIHGDYKRPFYIAIALFVASFAFGYLGSMAEELSNEPSSHELNETIEIKAEAEAKPDSLTDEEWEAFNNALREGDNEESKRLMNKWAIAAMNKPTPQPSLPTTLILYWFTVLIVVLGVSLACIGLGFLLGFIPAAVDIILGITLGRGLWNTQNDGTGWSLIEIFGYIPSITLLSFSIVVSIAVGFDLAKYITRQDKGTWFIEHIRKGIKVWSTTALPCIVMGMIVLTGVYLVRIINAGN